MVRLLFLVYAAVEIAALWAVSSAIGVGWAILLVMVGTALGAVAFGSQVRRLIASVAASGRSSSTAGRGLGRTLADGSVSMIGVGLLLVPGLVTSALGLLFLFPPTRAILRPLVMRSGLRRFTATAGRAGGAAGRGRAGDPGIVDGEVVTDPAGPEHGRGAGGTPSPGRYGPEYPEILPPVPRGAAGH